MNILTVALPLKRAALALPAAAAAAAVLLLVEVLLVSDERSNAATLCLDRDEEKEGEEDDDDNEDGAWLGRGAPLGDNDRSLKAASLPKPLLSLPSSLSEKWPEQK